MAIGVFDSGVGGLTVYKELAKAFTDTDLIYLGDTARVPYGNKSPQVIVRYAKECARYLVTEYKVSSLIVACNTISSYALEPLEEEFGLPVMGVIQAGSKQALRVTKNNKIGVIGTRATINSGAYSRMLQSLAETAVTVEQQACPLFVPLVEEGFISGDIPELTAQSYLDGLIAKGIDTLILACTHYPLLIDVIAKLYPHINIVDSATVMVEQMHEIGLDIKETGRRKIMITDASPAFEQLKTMLVGNIPMDVVNICSEEC